MTAGTVTVVVGVIGTVVVTVTSTGEKYVTEFVAVAAVGTSVTKTVDSVEVESRLVVSVSTSCTMATYTIGVVIVCINSVRAKFQFLG